MLEKGFGNKLEFVTRPLHGQVMTKLNQVAFAVEVLLVSYEGVCGVPKNHRNLLTQNLTIVERCLKTSLRTEILTVTILFSALDYALACYLIFIYIYIHFFVFK